MVDRETQEATAKKEIVQGEEAVANEKATASKAIKVWWHTHLYMPCYKPQLMYVVAVPTSNAGTTQALASSTSFP